MEHLRVPLLLARVFGFNCYLHHETKDGFVATLSWTGVCLFTANVLAYSYCAVENVRNPNIYISTGSHTVDLVGKLMIEFGFFEVVLIMAQNFGRNGWIGDLLNSFHAIDEHLRGLGVPTNYRAHNREAVLYMCASGLSIVGAILFSVYAARRENEIGNWAMFIGHLLISAATGIISNIFYAEVYALRCRIRTINRHLRDQLCDEDFRNLQPAFGRRKVKVNSASGASYREELVTRAAQIYDELQSISMEISNRNKFKIPGYCMLNIMYGIMAIFTLYRITFKPEEANKHTIDLFLLWAFVYKFSLFQLTLNSHRLGTEGRNAADLIGYAASQESNFKCIQKMHNLLCQAQHNPIKVTTYLFDFNLGTFFVIIGTISMYLFIMLQFSG